MGWFNDLVDNAPIIGGATALNPALGAAAFYSNTPIGSYLGMNPQDKQNYMNQQQSQLNESMQNIGKSAELGRKVGAEEFQNLFGDTEQYKKGLSDTLSTLQNRAQQGMTASEYAPLNKKFNQASMATQAAIGRSGVKGGAAAQMRSDVTRKNDLDRIAMDVAVRQQNFNALRDEYGKRAYASQALPLQYGALYSGQASTAAQLQALQNYSNPYQSPLQKSLGGIPIIGNMV